MSLYISLGVLAGLLLFGTLWNILLRKKRKAKPTKVLGEHLTYIVVCSSNQGKMTSLLTRHSHMCGWDSSLIKKINFFQSYSSEAAAVNEGMTSDTIHEDIKVARQLLEKTQEQFDKLEFQVSRLKYHLWLMVERCKSSNLVTWKFHVIIVMLQLWYLIYYYRICRSIQRHFM